MACTGAIGLAFACMGIGGDIVVLVLIFFVN